MTKSFCDVCNTDQTVNMPKNVFVKDLCEKCYDQFLKKITDIIQKVGELA